MTALAAHVQSGAWSTIVPKQYIDLMGLPAQARAYRLIEPDISHVMGFVIAKREPVSPLAQAMLSIAVRVPD